MKFCESLWNKSLYCTFLSKKQSLLWNIFKNPSTISLINNQKICLKHTPWYWCCSSPSTRVLWKQRNSWSWNHPEYLSSMKSLYQFKFNRAVKKLKNDLFYPAFTLMHWWLNIELFFSVKPRAILSLRLKGLHNLDCDHEKPKIFCDSHSIFYP